jgi:predicted ATP-dependent serine protease
VKNLKNGVNIISGECGSGKTEILLDMLCNYSKQHFNCVFFSIDNSGKRIVQKIMTTLNEADTDYIIVKYLTINNTFDDIEKLIKLYLNEQFDIDIVFIDDLNQLAFSRKKWTSMALSTMIDKLKDISMKYNIAIVVTTQSPKQLKESD